MQHPRKRRQGQDDERTRAVRIRSGQRRGGPEGRRELELLTGIVGTLAFAREIGATRAVFAVHEFVTDSTRDDRLARNAADLSRLLERLGGGAIGALSPGILVGPVRVPGNDRIPPLPLYIGKAVRTTRVRSARHR